MRIITIFILTLLTFPAYCANVQFHIESEHASGCETCNESNFGIGYRGDGKLALTGGYYTNSWFRDSFYVGLNYSVNPYLSFTGALVSGYAGTSDGVDNILIAGELLPVPIIHWRILDRKVSPMLSYTPTPDGGVMLFSLDYRLDN